MTRKRFKKLLMSYGYSRNDAEWLAERPKVLGISYQTYWDDNMPMFTVNLGLHQIKQTWQKIGKTTHSVMQAIEACWRGAFDG